MEYGNHKSTPQELGMLKRERSERFYFLVTERRMVDLKFRLADFVSLIHLHP